MTQPPAAVLDASALLAYLFGETGAEEVARLLERTCVMSAVNLSEVLSKVARYGLDPDAAMQRLEEERLLGSLIRVVPFDQPQAVEAARVQAASRRLGFSLGDCACLALARTLRLPAATADRSWRKLSAGIDILCIR